MQHVYVYILSAYNVAELICTMSVSHVFQFKLAICAYILDSGANQIIIRESRTMINVFSVNRITLIGACWE